MTIDVTAATPRSIGRPVLSHHSVLWVVALDFVRSENAEGENRAAYGQDQECHQRQHRPG